MFLVKQHMNGHDLINFAVDLSKNEKELWQISSRKSNHRNSQQ